MTPTTKPRQNAFKWLLGVCLVVVSMSTNALSLVFENQLAKVKVQINDTPCTNKKVRDRIVPAFLPYFQSGHSIIEGVRYELCWIPAERIDPVQGKGLVFIVDETGDNGPLPMSAFAKPDYL